MPLQITPNPRPSGNLNITANTRARMSSIVTIAWDSITGKPHGTIEGTANEITVTNGDGVSGDPTISIPTAVTLTGKTLTNGTFSSPSLTGTPTAPTQSALDNSTRIATTAYVYAATREKLTSSRTYYVRTNGSDSNTGLVNSAGGAFLTIQKALDTIASIDIATNAVTVSVADGTYTGANTVSAPWLGSGLVSVVGNTSTPANVIINPPGGGCFIVSGGGTLTISGMELRGNVGAWAKTASSIQISTAMRFGPTTAYQIYPNRGTITIGADYTICGGAINHISVDSGGAISGTSLNVTLTNAPAFSGNFLGANGAGCQLTYFLNTFIYPTITVTIASPGVVTYTAHGKLANDAVAFSTTGALPTGLTAGTTYYVKTVVDANNFTLSATPAGAVINTTGTQSGVHSITATGSRYSAASGGYISVNGAGTTYLPGNSAGAGTNFGVSPYGLYQ